MVWGQIGVDYVYGFQDTQFKATKFIPDDEFDEFNDNHKLYFNTYTNAIRRWRAREVMYGVRIHPEALATHDEQEAVKSEMQRIMKKYKMGTCELGYFVAIRSCELEYNRSHKKYEKRGNNEPIDSTGNNQVADSDKDGTEHDQSDYSD